MSVPTQMAVVVRVPTMRGMRGGYGRRTPPRSGRARDLGMLASRRDGNDVPGSDLLIVSRRLSGEYPGNKLDVPYMKRVAFGKCQT